MGKNVKNAMICTMAFWLLAGTFGVKAQSSPELTGIPGALKWNNNPAAFTVDRGSILEIAAGPKSDWFVDPFDGKMAKNAPILAFVPAEDYVLSTKVTVKFTSKWDAGALMLWADDHHWAKFALELSPEKQPTVVTVVTRGLSDDCNSVPITGDTVYLQIARKKSTYVFYYGMDGTTWKIVRTFNLSAQAKMSVGFESQSPAGEGTKAEFSQIQYSPKTITNVYTGK
jgi:regulation of enolase protein 1 (concanavalin A-like superfamily)